MRNKRILIAIVLLQALFQSCNNEEKKLTHLLSEKDITLAYEFKAKHPNTTFNIDSLIEALEYLKIRNSPFIDRIENFRSKFPNSIYKDSAAILIQGLEWKNIKKYGYPRDLTDEYIRKYPHCPKRFIAEEAQFASDDIGTFTDTRDGRRYNWGKFADQIWMTQNLNYSSNYSVQRNIYEHNRNRIDHDAGRAYYESVVWDVCPEGWDLPAVEDYISLVFSMGAKIHIIQYAFFLNIRRMAINGGHFRPYLDFDKYIDDRTRSWVRINHLSGTSYWTKSYYKYTHRDEVQTRYLGFSWKKKGLSRSREANQLENIHLRTFDHRTALPVRCIKRDNPHKSIFKPIESDLIVFDGIEMNLSDLPKEGYYGRIQDSQDTFYYPVLIQYIGSKMFVFIGDEGEHRRNFTMSFVPFYVSYSKESGHFTLKKFTNSTSHDHIFGNGTLLKLENDRIILSYKSRNDLIEIEYHNTPFAKVTLANIFR